MAKSKNGHFILVPHDNPSFVDGVEVAAVHASLHAARKDAEERISDGNEGESFLIYALMEKVEALERPVATKTTIYRDTREV